MKKENIPADIKSKSIKEAKNEINDILNQLPKDILDHTILHTLNREYTLNEIAIMTRSAPAKILGLTKKGNFSNGSDADVTIYDKNKKDPEEMFAHPSMVLKDGTVVVENGKIKEYVWGKTQTVAPEYDKPIERNLGRFFEKYHTMKLDNYILSDDEMNSLVGSPVYVNDCKYKRKQ